MGMETYNTILEGLGKNYHLNADVEHGIHRGMSKDFEKTANLDFDEMQVVVDIFDSMPEGPWDTDTGD